MAYPMVMEQTIPTGTIAAPLAAAAYQHMNAAAKSRFAPESTNEFSDDPFVFEESAKLLWEDTRIAYHHACIENRFTDEYLKLCTRLEKNIRQVGSCCLTKAALEQEGRTFSGLDSMNIYELLKMVSYHLRKCHAAFREIYQEDSLLGLSYLNQEVRWVELGNRLKATDLKIQKIKDGQISVEDTVKREEPKAAEPCETTGTAAEKEPRSLRLSPAALPIDGSLVKEAVRCRKEAEKKEREAERFQRDIDRIWGINTGPFPMLNIGSFGGIGSIQPQFPYCSNKNGGTGTVFLEVEEARKVLLEDARERNDREALMKIPTEDGNALEARWFDFCEEPPDDS